MTLQCIPQSAWDEGVWWNVCDCLMGRVRVPTCHWFASAPIVMLLVSVSLRGCMGSERNAWLGLGCVCEIRVCDGKGLRVFGRGRARGLGEGVRGPRGSQRKA